jgi:hypothetical protein
MLSSFVERRFPQHFHSRRGKLRRETTAVDLTTSATVHPIIKSRTLTRS